MGENFKRVNLDNEFFFADYQSSLKIVKEVFGVNRGSSGSSGQ